MNPSDDKEPLNQGFELPKPKEMQGRVLFGLALAVVGICLGVVGTVFSLPYLAIPAGICAVGGCFIVGGATLLPLIQRTAQDGSTPTVNAQRSSSIDPALIPDESVVDKITELPDGRFFEVAVEGRVAAARRHLWPVSIVLLQLGFDPAAVTPQSRERSLKSFSNLMRQTLREADIACRIDDTTFGLILEDTSEEGGVWTAERLQIALSHDATNIRRLVAGVAAYPTHGLFSKDVLVRAQAALRRASSTPTQHGLGQVEVATVDLS